MRFKREKASRTIAVTDIPLRVDGITTLGDAMTIRVSYEGDSSARVGHTLDNAVIPLIAAAPDLLSALLLAVRVMQDNGIDESMAGEFDVFTDAIAKAEGRA